MQAIKNRLQALPDAKETHLRAFLALYQNQMLSSAGLVIKGASSALAKTGAAATTAIAGGVLQKIAAATDMAALSGTVVTATKNVYVFSIDAGGTLYSAMGGASAAVSGITFPVIPEGRAVIGFILVENATGADFVGGTTALDVASLTVTYLNNVGPFYPVSTL